MTSPEKTKCRVYWIHLPEHTDMFSQGYVGITVKTVEHRYAQHTQNTKHKTKRNTINNAINKYGDRLICEKVLEGSVEYCRGIENKLRPLPNIGWNISIGGDLPPMTGRKHSEESRTKMSLSNNRELSRLRAIGNEHWKFQTKEWESTKYKGKQWQNAAHIFETVQKFPSAGFRKIHTLSGLPKEIGDLKQVFTKIKTGWIPTLDTKYMSWYSTNK